MRNRVIQNFIAGIALLSCFGIGNAQQTLPSATTAVSGIAPVAATAATSVPALVPYSGTALDVKGTPLAGETSATFLIYKDQQGGEPLYSESQVVAFDEAGRYKVQLGASSPNGLPAELFSTGEARWLEVQIAGQPAEPRVLLASVPYALKAADAATLGGLPASAFALVGSNASINAAAASGVTPNASSAVTTPGGTSGYIPEFTGISTIADSPVFVSGSSVGIGTTTPAQTLDVNGTTVFRNNVYVYHNGTATPSAGVNSVPMVFLTEGYNSNTKAVVAPAYQLKAETAGNNTSAPSATFNLLYSNGSTTAETGFHFNPNGTITFAAGQTFPGGTGSGTITGVTAGTDLTGGGTSGNVTLKLDTTKVPTLAGNNTYTGSNVFVPSLYEDTDINIDNTNANSGGISPGLRFGNGSGEGMASQRVSGGDNLYGLDFFTGYTRQMSIAQGGYVGVGGLGTPGVTLSSYAGSNANAAYFQSNANAATLYIENDSSNTVPTLYSTGPNGYCAINNDGSIVCSGSIGGSNIMNDKRVLATYGVQSAENWYEDYGSGQLHSGSAQVSLDADFRQTVNTTVDYHVFLTPNGDCKGLYVANKTPGGFEVHELGGGATSVGFDYKIVAKRKGYEQLRLADITEKVQKQTEERLKRQSASDHPASHATIPPIPQQTGLELTKPLSMP